ncbi:MAG TPA: pyridoxamine 5'-phosphate oxidase family protein [Anaeromyxobacteraceae bacterium]|nr:pyridoxamine 5'-phosphate oxidase family protein [Anaeromyxobacteraceae bacterium]
MPTPRTTLQRHPERGSHDRAVIDAILDEALVAHVGFSQDGQTFVLPMSFARAGDRLYVHGAAASRALASLRSGAPACVTVTLLDGLVLARSAFRHSVNYRSVVILGVARAVEGRDAKREALVAIVEHMVPGRSADVRAPTDAEVDATAVVWLPLDEASAKVRSGPPVDLEADLSRPGWAGEIPLRLAPGAPVAERRVAPATPVPERVARYRRGR